MMLPILVLRNIQLNQKPTKDFHVTDIFNLGIDPAGPAFHNNVSIDERLDPTDADFVDVWHCNAGDCLPYCKSSFGTKNIEFTFQ